MSGGDVPADREESLLRIAVNENALTQCRQSGETEAVPQGYSSESPPTIEGRLRAGALAAETSAVVVPRIGTRTPTGVEARGELLGTGSGAA